jgi:hypothetical protein
MVLENVKIAFDNNDDGTKRIVIDNMDEFQFQMVMLGIKVIFKFEPIEKPKK